MNLPAEQADIALTVWQLRQRGATTNEIARQLGVPTSRVGALLRQELLQASHDLAETTRQELLALELARLDNLQSANWDMALQGDTRAGELCLKVMDRRAKLLGIDQNQTEDTAKVQTVVVTGTPEGYVEALRSIADRQISAGDDDGS